MTKSIMLALAAAGTLLCSANANAGGHVSWSVGINAPAVGAVVSSGPVYGYPAYGYPVYESYPTYAPVYVQPAPVYYGPAPAYYGPPAYYYRHRHHGYRPVVVAPYPRHWR